jgi:hypothetical protein
MRSDTVVTQISIAAPRESDALIHGDSCGALTKRRHNRL